MRMGLTPLAPKFYGNHLMNNQHATLMPRASTFDDPDWTAQWFGKVLESGPEQARGLFYKFYQLSLNSEQLDNVLTEADVRLGSLVPSSDHNPKVLVEVYRMLVYASEQLTERDVDTLPDGRDHVQMQQSALWGALGYLGSRRCPEEIVAIARIVASLER